MFLLSGCYYPFTTCLTLLTKMVSITMAPASRRKRGRRRIRRRTTSRASAPGSTICRIEDLKILTQVSGCQLTKACTAPSLFGIPEANTEEVQNEHCTIIKIYKRACKTLSNWVLQQEFGKDWSWQGTFGENAVESKIFGHFAH